MTMRPAVSGAPVNVSTSSRRSIARLSRAPARNPTAVPPVVCVGLLVSPVVEAVARRRRHGCWMGC